MEILLKGGRVVDPAAKLDKVCDVLIRDGKIAEVGESLSTKGETKDCAGMIVVPGLIDMHVHLREPGYEYKEDIASGTRAAAKGGFTGVCPMPNTLPVSDTGSVVRFINDRARDVGAVKVYPIGALSQGLEGKEMAEIGDMVSEGAVAFSDDGKGLQDAGLLRRCMDYAVQFGVPVLSHCEDEALVGKGAVNEGTASSRLGLRGWPSAGEDVAVERDIALAELTGCPLHICHISTARALDMVRAAKARGVKVTCEAMPHHLFLNEDAIDGSYNTNLKMNPPLRTVEDAQALIDGILDGTVDVIASDHAPHTPQEKALEFELAPFGTTGLETSLALVLTHLVGDGSEKIDMSALVKLMAIKPREILGLEQVTFAPGSTADITVIDPATTWTVEVNDFESKSKNSAFIGHELTGRARDVFVDGVAALEDGKVVTA